MLSIAKDAEIIDLGERVEANFTSGNPERREKFAFEKRKEIAFREKKVSEVDRNNSCATEDILRRECDNKIKANPGMKHSILGEYRKKGR